MLCSPRALAPFFLARHPPHRPIPGAQRQTRVLENRACRHRSLIIALSAAQQAPPTAASSLPFTAGTPKTLRPAQLHQILATRLLSAKTPLKLLQRTRVVLHEPAYYMLGLRESSAYPDRINMTHNHRWSQQQKRYSQSCFRCSSVGCVEMLQNCFNLGRRTFLVNPLRFDL